MTVIRETGGVKIGVLCGKVFFLTKRKKKITTCGDVTLLYIYIYIYIYKGERKLQFFFPKLNLNTELLTLSGALFSFCLHVLLL